MSEANREKLEFNKLRKRIRKNVGKAISDYNMIEEGDVVMACLSGGKDSFGMLDILIHLKKQLQSNLTSLQLTWIKNSQDFPSTFCPNISAA